YPARTRPDNAPPRTMCSPYFRVAAVAVKTADAGRLLTCRCRAETVKAIEWGSGDERQGTGESAAGGVGPGIAEAALRGRRRTVVHRRPDRTAGGRRRCRAMVRRRTRDAAQVEGRDDRGHDVRHRLADQGVRRDGGT